MNRKEKRCDIDGLIAYRRFDYKDRRVFIGARSWNRIQQFSRLQEILIGSHNSERIDRVQVKIEETRACSGCISSSITRTAVRIARPPIRPLAAQPPPRIMLLSSCILLAAFLHLLPLTRIISTCLSLPSDELHILLPSSFGYSGQASCLLEIQSNTV